LGECSLCNDIRDKLQVANVIVNATLLNGYAVFSVFEFAIPIYHSRGSSPAYSIQYSDISQYAESTDLPEDGRSNISIVSYLDDVSPAQATSWPLIANFLTLGVPSPDYLSPWNLSYTGGAPMEADLRPLIQAFNCSLYFCLKTYEGHRTNGVMQQKLSSTWSHPRSDGLGFENIPHTMILQNSSSDFLDEDSLTSLQHAAAPLVTENATGKDSEDYGYGTGTIYSPGTRGIAVSVQSMLNSTTTLEDISA
jgi:hypothetical protein